MFDKIKKFIGTLKENPQVSSTSTIGSEIFRYGKKGSKLGMLDVLIAKNNSEFHFKTKDDQTYNVSVTYNSEEKIYILVIYLGGQIVEEPVAYSTKGKLEIELGKKLNKLGFIGRDYKGLMAGANYAKGDIISFEDKIDESSDFDSLDQSEKNKYEKLLKEVPQSRIWDYSFKENLEKEEVRAGIGSFELANYLIQHTEELYKIEKSRGPFSKIISVNDKLKRLLTGKDGSHLLVSRQPYNMSRYSLFCVFVEQMGFSSGGPRIGGMTGASDFKNLDTSIFDNYLNSPVEVRRKIEGLMVDMIKVNGRSRKQMLDSYERLFDFLEKDQKIELNTIRTLRRKLVFLMSNLWNLQKPLEFPIYSGAARDVVSNSGEWFYDKNLKPTENYDRFCKYLNNYLPDKSTARSETGEKIGEALGSESVNMGELENYRRSYERERLMEKYSDKLNNSSWY